MLNNIFEIAVIVAAVLFSIDKSWSLYRKVADTRLHGYPIFPSLKKPRATNDKEREYLDGPL